MKGLILCAGKGTRLQPLSFTVPKVMLPVANKPVLHYCVEKLAELGIKDIGIVIQPSQENIIKDNMGSGERFGVTITYIYQNEPKGISHAVKQAETFIHQEPFLLLLGDNLLGESLSTLKESVELLKSNSSILLGRVKNPQDYGIAEIEGDRIISLEEKPKSPKSNLAVIGAYAFDSNIFKAIHAISPSARGEYEITDALQWMIDNGYSLSYFETKKYHFDVGTVKRLLEANRFMLNNDSENHSKHLQNIKYVNCTFIPPVAIEEGCELSHSIIGPHVSIASGVKIEGCHIENSIIYEQSSLHGIPFKVKDSILGRHILIQGSSAEVIDNVEYILGDKSVVLYTQKQEEADSQ